MALIDMSASRPAKKAVSKKEDKEAFLARTQVITALLNSTVWRFLAPWKVESLAPPKIAAIRACGEATTGDCRMVVPPQHGFAATDECTRLLLTKSDSWAGESQCSPADQAGGGQQHAHLSSFQEVMALNKATVTATPTPTRTPCRSALCMRPHAPPNHPTLDPTWHSLGDAVISPSSPFLPLPSPPSPLPFPIYLLPSHLSPLSIQDAGHVGEAQGDGV